MILILVPNGPNACDKQFIFCLYVSVLNVMRHSAAIFLMTHQVYFWFHLINFIAAL